MFASVFDVPRYRMTTVVRRVHRDVAAMLILLGLGALLQAVALIAFMFLWRR